MTRGGVSENRVEMTESGLELNPKDTQLSRDPSYRCEFSTECDTVRRGSWGRGHGLTLTPARRAPLRQGAAAQDRGGQGTSCPTSVCGRLTGHGKEAAAPASTSCFWAHSSCWGSVSPPLAYEKQQKKEGELGSLAFPGARGAKGQGRPSGV